MLGVSLVVMLGGRFLTKAARFHHLEREHLAAVMQFTLAMQSATSSDTAAVVGKEVLLRAIKRAKWTADQADAELFRI